MYGFKFKNLEFTDSLISYRFLEDSTDIRVKIEVLIQYGPA